MKGHKDKSKITVLSLSLLKYSLKKTKGYFILRPNNKKQEDVKNLQKNLKKGDSIVTIGGIHGKILQVRNNKATIRVSNNSELTVDITAVSRLKNSDNKE